MSYRVEYYQKGDGTYPVEDFILQQDNKVQAKIFSILEILEEKGPALREPYSKPLDDGIFEIRVRQGCTYRILYFFITGKRAILTNGFVKKTQKTPPEEIDLAKKYRKDFKAKERL